MEWLILIISSMFEVSVMVNLEKSEGFKKIRFTILSIVSQIISLYMLSLTLNALPLNVAYATWTGLGTIGSIIFGIIFLNESKDKMKFIWISFIIFGIAGLKVFSG